MILIKKFTGNDGVEREWAMDTEEKILTYKGLARDFQKEEKDE